MAAWGISQSFGPLGVDASHRNHNTTTPANAIASTAASASASPPFPARLNGRLSLAPTKALRPGVAVALPGRRRAVLLRVRAAHKVSTVRTYLLCSTLVARGEEFQLVSHLCHQIREWAREKQQVRMHEDKKCGIRQFECYVDTFDSNVLHFWEQYDSFIQMHDLRSLPEHKQFMTEVRPLLTGPISLAVYEYTDGQIGGMLNPIGPTGEGGLDDAITPARATRRGMKELYTLDEFTSEEREAIEKAWKDLGRSTIEELESIPTSLRATLSKALEDVDKSTSEEKEKEKENENENENEKEKEKEKFGGFNMKALFGGKQ